MSQLRSLPSELRDLSTEKLGVVVDIANGVPAVLHWGATVGPLLAGVSAARDLPALHGNLDLVAPTLVVPEHGSGFFGRPGLLGHRADGSGWSPRFVPERVDDDAGRLDVLAIDKVAQLSLRTEMTVGESGCMRTRVTLRNEGPDPYVLDALRVTLPVPAQATELLTFSGRWSSELRQNRQRFTDATVTLDNWTGRTSHYRVPVAFFGPSGFTENDAEVWGVHLEWSGGSSVVFDMLPDGRRVVQVGELLFPGEVSLASGETYATPWVASAYSTDGTNGVSQTFHRELRSRPGHPTTARPVTLNTWEAVYFDHDLPTLQALADRGAAVGVERFVLDDGWFQGRRHDRAGLGDWWVDADVWPEGLRPLITHVRSLGMQFGIWVEPECVSPDSELFRSHPEWALVDAGYEPVLARHQLVLDLGRPEVRDYLFEQLSALLRDHDISYLKWDMNRELVHASHDGRAGVRNHTLGLYELWRRLRAEHPDVEIESCASGGGRGDFAILEHTKRVWTSDCQDPLERQQIQRGFSYLFPPELMGAHIAAPTSHSTGRTQTLAFRAATAFFGHFGIEWNLLDVSDVELRTLRDVVDLHKRFRPLLHSGEVFRLDHVNPSILAFNVVATNKSSALVSVTQLTAPASLLVEPLRLRGLDDQRTYHVSVLDIGGRVKGLAKRQPGWFADGVTLTGRQLDVIGLQLPVLDPESTMVLHVVSARR